MFKKLIIRLSIAIAFGVPVAFFSVAAGKADEALPGTSSGECQDCHEIVQTHWAESSHANAVSNPAFQLDWNEQGQPDECFACHTTGYDPDTGDWDVASVSCTTCHSPIPGNHPDQIMPTDVSSRLCGECHLETYSEWTQSTHAQQDLACVRCHSPHTNSIRATDTQELCSSCHAEEVHFFQYTAHYEEGLLCIDCHVRVLDGDLGEGHGQREHTFEVDMATCSNCHSDEMHYPMPGVDGSAMGGGGTGIDTLSSSIQSSPNPVSPLGFALVATLVGAALGMIIAPWSERIFRRTDR
jgi:hypothetical protein